jgi:hypothetical protein
MLRFMVKLGLHGKRHWARELKVYSWFETAL